MKEEEDSRVIHGVAESTVKERKDRVSQIGLIQEILKGLFHKLILMIFNVDTPVPRTQHQKTLFLVLESAQIEHQRLRIEARPHIPEQRVEIRHLNKAQDWKTVLKKVRTFISR